MAWLLDVHRIINYWTNCIRPINDLFKCFLHKKDLFNVDFDFFSFFHSQELHWRRTQVIIREREWTIHKFKSKKNSKKIKFRELNLVITKHENITQLNATESHFLWVTLQLSNKKKKNRLKIEIYLLFLLTLRWTEKKIKIYLWFPFPFLLYFSFFLLLFVIIINTTGKRDCNKLLVFIVMLICIQAKRYFLHVYSINFGCEYL